MSDSARPPVTDSPWFWVLAFSLMALLALGVVGASGKYGKRQARIERQYQARQRVAETLVAKDATESGNDPGAPTDLHTTTRNYATPGNTLLPLWPLGAILGLISVVALIMLRRGAAESSIQGSDPA